MTAAYQRAGLTAGEIERVGGLVGAVEAADPTAPWVAVRREDVVAVVDVLDQLVDRAPRNWTSTATARLVIVVVDRRAQSGIVIPDLEAVIRVLRSSGRWPGA